MIRATWWYCTLRLAVLSYVLVLVHHKYEESEDKSDYVPQNNRYMGWCNS